MVSQTFPRMHISYYVSDIDKTVDFYNKFFGVPPQKVKSGYAKYILEQPSLIISFVQHPERVSNNFGHFGFEVDSQEALKVKLGQAMQHQLPIDEEKGVNCCYALQDKFWVTDPDGIQWETYYFHQDSEFNDPKYSKVEEGSACCEFSDEKKQEEAVKENTCC